MELTEELRCLRLRGARVKVQRIGGRWKAGIRLDKVYVSMVDDTLIKALDRAVRAFKGPRSD